LSPKSNLSSRPQSKSSNVRPPSDNNIEPNAKNNTKSKLLSTTKDHNLNKATTPTSQHLLNNKKINKDNTGQDLSVNKDSQLEFNRNSRNSTRLSNIKDNKNEPNFINKSKDLNVENN